MKVAIFQFSLFGINTYVVSDPVSRECAIIDPGMSTPREIEALRNYVTRENLIVTNIINTHLHIDHAVGNTAAANLWNVPISAHKEDMPLGERMEQQAMQFGIPGVSGEAGVTSFLNEGDEIKIGSGTLHVLHVPGHSPGSIVLYDKEDGFLIGGDVLFQGSIGRTDLPGGSMPQLLEGIKGKLLTLPDNTIVYPGHGPATTIGDERRMNPFLR